MREIGIIIRNDLRLRLRGQKLFRSSKMGKTQKSVLSWILLLYIFGYLIFSSYTTAYALAKQLEPFGELLSLPVLALSATGYLSLFFMIFSVKSFVYTGKDLPMLMSMPIKPSKLLAARLIGQILYCLAFALMVAVPYLVVYFQFAGFSLLLLVRWILAYLFAPCVPLAVSLFVAYGLSWVGTRMEEKPQVRSALYMILTLALMVGIIYFAGNAEHWISQLGFGFGAKAISLYPLGALFSGTLNGNLWSILLLAVLSVAPLWLLVTLLSPSYKRCVERFAYRNISHAGKSAGRLERRNVKKALFSYEIKRFFATPIYMMNTAFGDLLVMIGAVVLLFVPKATIEGAFGDMGGMSFSMFIPVIIALMQSMDSPTACAISIEGKNLWILRAAPITGMQVFQAKMCLPLVMHAVSLVFSWVLLALSGWIQGTMLLWTLLIPASYALFTAEFGLMANLLLPNLHWTNIMEPVKQSMSVMLAVFGAMAFTAIPVLLFVLSGSGMDLFALCWFCVMLLLSLLVYRWLATFGMKRYKRLMEDS